MTRARLRSWILLACVAGLACAGPLGPIPGGALSGAVAPAPESWDFTANVQTIQLETGPGRPHSVNVWCLGLGARLYVPTSMVMGPVDPLERTWVRNVDADGAVRVRIDGQIYAMRAVRVTDPQELVDVRNRLRTKYELERSTRGRDQTGWIFRLEPRELAR